MEQLLDKYTQLYLTDKMWLGFVVLVVCVVLWFSHKVTQLIPLKEVPEVVKSKRYSGFKLVRLGSLLVMLYPMKYAAILGSLLFLGAGVIRYVLVQKHLPDMLLKGIDRGELIKTPDKLLSKQATKDVAEVVYRMMQLGRSVTIIFARESDLGAVEKTGVPLGRMRISKNTLLGVCKGFEGMAIVIRDNNMVAVGVELPEVIVSDYEGLEEADQDIGGIVGLAQIYDCVGLHVSGSTAKLSVVGNHKGSLRTYLGLSALEKDLREGVVEGDIENILKQMMNVKVRDENIFDKKLPKPKTTKEKKKQKEETELEIRIKEVERERNKLNKNKKKDRPKRENR